MDLTKFYDACTDLFARLDPVDKSMRGNLIEQVRATNTCGELYVRREVGKDYEQFVVKIGVYASQSWAGVYKKGNSLEPRVMLNPPANLVEMIQTAKPIN